MLVRISGNESPPGLQILEKLATPVLCPVKDATYPLFLCFKQFEFEYDTNKCARVFFFCKTYSGQLAGPSLVLF